MARTYLAHERVYLDWASAAPVSNGAKKAFLKAMENWGNPGSPHAEGVRAKAHLEQARLTIARLAGVKTDGVIFTSGATEANALAIQGHVKALRAKGRKNSDIHLLYVPTAHASVVETMQSLAEEGISVEPLAITDGAIDLAVLAMQIRPETALVSVDVVCGETGTRYAVRDVRRTLDAARAAQNSVASAYGTIGSRILLHADASQAPFAESFEHTHLGADLITLDAQKVGGVRGIGALIRSNVLIPLESLVQGGGQEFGLRPGTENPALATAFAAALTEAHEGREKFSARAAGAREKLVASVMNAFLKTHINVGKSHVPHIINLSFPNTDTDYAVMLLSEAGFDVSTKSACETNEEGSRAVFGLTNDSDRARTTLRISFGPTTTDKQLQNFAHALISCIQFLDSGVREV